jgi:hypothetical protein
LTMLYFLFSLGPLSKGSWAASIAYKVTPRHQTSTSSGS